MYVVHTKDEVRAWVDAEKRAGKRIAFVPTMGNLHQGHIELVKRGFEVADRVIVSIFVNPTQFGVNEDFAKYPRTFAEDCDKLKHADTNLLFFPDVHEMYPEGSENATRVHVPGISEILCGASRPGHFVGVATVVAKFFNIVQPHVAIFGEKDFQQVIVIKRMVADLFLPLEIVRVATKRDSDGLAMSSRNRYLTPDERAKAPAIYKTMVEISDRIQSGETDFATLEHDASEKLKNHGFSPEYFSIRNVKNLETIDPQTDNHVVILVAVRLGQTRLIDNLTVSLR